jgi:hypothetical protein
LFFVCNIDDIFLNLIKIKKSSKTCRVFCNYFYHMARKCHFASASTICGAEALAEAFRLTIYLKQNIIIFVKNYRIGNLSFFNWQHKGSKKQLSRQKLTNSSNIQNRRRPLSYKWSLDNPPRPLLLYTMYSL